MMMTSGLLCFLLFSLTVVVTPSDEVLPLSSDNDGGLVETCETLIQTTAVDAPNSVVFEKFKADHGRVYPDQLEENYRYEVFSQALARIASKNQNRKERGAEQTQGITKFSDKTYEEFKKYLGFKPHKRRISRTNGTTPATPAVECPACENFEDIVLQAKSSNEVNWVEVGAVTAVKNQGTCGSCWAFSTVADIEGAYYMKYKTLTSRSEEQLVQCDTTDSGCDGGMMEYAMEYIKSVDGLDSDLSYPYLQCSLKGSTYCLGYKSKCSSFTSGIGVNALGRVSGYSQISYNNANAEPDIKTALFTSGPLSCAINAYPMLDYSSGIDDPDDCGNKFSNLNHGVAFVGFGTSQGTQYWLIRNSWGSDWGVNGYYMIVYGSNACGVSLYVLHAVIS